MGDEWRLKQKVTKPLTYWGIAGMVLLGLAVGGLLIGFGYWLVSIWNWLVVLAVVLTIVTLGFWWFIYGIAWGLQTVAAWFITIPDPGFETTMAVALAFTGLSMLLSALRRPWLRFKLGDTDD